MANLVSKYSTQPVLHTYSKYNQDYDFTLRNYNPDDIISKLEAKEKEVYALFAATNYEQFITEVRALFNMSEADKRAIINFSQDRLASVISSWRNQKLEEDMQNKTWRLKLTINQSQFRDGLFSAEEQFNKLLDDKFKYIDGDGYTLERVSTGSKIQFNLTVPGLNIQNLKHAVDSIYGTNFWYKANSKTVGSTKKGSLNEFFEKKEANNLLEWMGDEDTNTLYFEYNDAFSFKKEKVKSTNQTDMNAVEQGKQWIYDKLKAYIDYNSVSTEMKKAFDAVWKINFSTHISAAFFMKGGSNDAIYGAMGEFQGLLLTNYFLYKQLPSRVGKALLSRVDDVFKSGEAGRSDISFYKNIGIQVKNYSSQSVNNFTSHLKTTTYLGDLNKNYLKKEPNLEKMPQFLANYFFNSTFADNEEMLFKTLTNDILPDYFAEIANFDLNDTLKDRNSFYLIEGRYLVPVSDIYKTVMQNIEDRSVSITSSFMNERKSDEEFAKLPKTYHEDSYSRKRKSLAKQQDGNALYTLYWKYAPRAKSSEGTPTTFNKETYRKMVNKGISIRTNFKRAGFSVDKYSLY